MTSRVSFPKLLIETLRRHLTAVLITVLGFFIHIIGFFMNVQNIISGVYIAAEYSVNELLSGAHTTKVSEELEYLLRELAELCNPNLTNGVIAAIFGAYLAFDFFRYMHSKRETDLYDSLPIRRQTWFRTIFTSTFALFFVLCTVTIGIETAIVYGTGYGSASILQDMMWNLICMLICFLISWFTTALAMVMTGHTVIALLGYGVFASYIPLILAFLVPVYCGRFFETYVSADYNELLYYFSPVTLIYKMTNSWYDWKLAEHTSYIIGGLIFTAIVGMITYLLFLRRPSEAAGRAMAFEKVNSVIRFMLVIPLALYAGLFLEEMAYTTSTAWLIFGAVFGAFLLHGIMECIFQFDIRALVNKKKQLLFTILTCLAFIFVFWIDLFKFDEYVPDAKDVKMVKMESHLFGYEDNTKKDWLQGELVDDAIAVVKDIRNSEMPSDDEYYYMDHVTITYVMNNGLEVKRAYSYDASRAPESLCELYANEDFKDDHCILYTIEPDEIISFNISNGLEYIPLNLSNEDLETFIDIYLEEYATLELSQIFTDSPVYAINIDYQTNDSQYDSYNSYYVYSSFKNTIAFLEEKGIMNFYESENAVLTNMEVYDYYENHKESNAYKSMYISDAAQLKELKQYMLICDFMDHKNIEDYLYAEVAVTSTDGTRYISVYIKKADIDKVINAE